MPYHRISKLFEFSAAHSLPSLPPEHPCHRLHGHNYAVTVELSGTTLDEHGMLLDYRALDVFKAWLDANVEHRNLNDVAPGGLTTAEALSAWLHQVLDGNLLSRELSARQLQLRVGVSETHKTWAHFPG